MSLGECLATKVFYFIQGSYSSHQAGPARLFASYVIKKVIAKMPA